MGKGYPVSQDGVTGVEAAVRQRKESPSVA
jgi:hypothetical protein